jgi:pyruvate dehydrogenase E2 component (dihydrolipoamide acetyltransferase)
MPTQVLVPPLGQTVDTLTFVSWYHAEGDTVQQGAPLFVVETDKATLDVEAPASGVLRRVTARPGDQVASLSAIAVIMAPDEPEDAAPQAPAAAPAAVTAQAASPIQASLPAGDRVRRFASPRARRVAQERQVNLAVVTGTGPEGAIVERDVLAYLESQQVAARELETSPAEAGPVAATPVARRMAEEAGLDWQSLRGSGPGGRVTRADVERAMPAGPGRPLAEEEVVEAVPLTGVRGIIARRMADSARETAAVTLTAEVDATELVAVRRRLVERGWSVTYNDLLIYVLGRALREHPRLNASLEGDAIKAWRRIDIGLAVDTDRGLIVPVVRDADTKGLAQIAEETVDLVNRTRAGTVTPDEIRGGTFTLTNLGMFGIDAFTPIINLPETAILGVGRIKERPAVVDGQVVARSMVWLSLTFDHRLVDGGLAARFLQQVAQLIEQPVLLLL